MTDLKDRAPAHALLKRLRQEMAVTTGNRPGPIPAHARSWHQGILGELEVAKALDTLPRGWLVLHSVPAGENGSDIDHVVVSPTGRVITINTKHHRGADIWVGEQALMVNRHKQNYLPIARSEAARAAVKLTRAVGHPVTVQPFIVFVGTKPLTIRQPPARVTVATTWNLVGLLETAGRNPGTGDSAAIKRAASESGTWSRLPLDSASSAELIVWFMTMLEPDVPPERTTYVRPVTNRRQYQPQRYSRPPSRHSIAFPLKVAGIVFGAIVGSMWIGGLMLELLVATMHTG